MHDVDVAVTVADKIAVDWYNMEDMFDVPTDQGKMEGHCQNCLAAHTVQMFPRSADHI